MELFTKHTLTALTGPAGRHSGISKQLLGAKSVPSAHRPITEGGEGGEHGAMSLSEAREAFKVAVEDMHAGVADAHGWASTIVSNAKSLRPDCTETMKFVEAANEMLGRTQGPADPQDQTAYVHPMHLTHQ